MLSVGSEYEDDSIVDFKNPPITEAVCGIAFRRIERFLAPHVGLLWALFRDDYPRVEEKSPLTPPKQAIDGDENVSLAEIIGRPRIWFVREDETRLIQVQQDRFLHNWKKVKADEYTVIQDEYAAPLGDPRGAYADAADRVRREPVVDKEYCYALDAV